MSFRSARSCALYPGAHAVWRTSSRPAPSAGSSVRKVVGNPVGITRNRTQKASQNHSVIWYVRFAHPAPTKPSTYPWSGSEQNHPRQTKAGMRERERSSGPETDRKVFWLIRILRRYALVGRRPTTTPLWGEIPRREANETYALLGRCGSFRGVRHPECLRLRRTGGRLPGGPSARQARGGPGH